MKPMIEMLLPHATIISRPRLSQLSYIGQKKLSRLPRRSAVVTFSVNDVYAIAEACPAAAGRGGGCYGQS